MKTLRCSSIFLIVFFFFATFAAAQRRRGTLPKPQSAPPAQQSAPAFENVLASDSYRVYVEVRGVGHLLKMSSFNEVMEPIMKVASPPSGFKTLLSWLNSQTDELTSSRLMVASWPARPKLPNVLLAIEFASPEEAQKFEPRLKTFLPTIFPTPAPASSSSGPKTSSEHRDMLAEEREAVRRSEQGDKAPAGDSETIKTTGEPPKEVLPSFVIKQAGSLVFVSDTSFTFKSLRPSGSKLLTEDPNFRRVHDRFATESILVYFDSGALEREEEERRRQAEEELAKRSEPIPPDPHAPESRPPDLPEQSDMPEPLPPPPPVDPDVVPQVQLETRRQTSVRIDETSQRATSPDIGTMLIGRMANVLFSGKSAWPEAIGVALAFDADSYALRLLLVNEPGVRGDAIPFMPQLISGPALTPEAAALFPADTEFFATLSLDYPQIYESMTKAFADQKIRYGMTTADGEVLDYSPFTVFETKSGIKLKNDLIPLLGNEVALMLPLKTLDVGPQSIPAPPPSESDGAETGEKPRSPATPNPVIAIGIRDREGVRALIPKLIEAVGFKGASLLAQTEKRGDTEVVSYADALSYAFIGNFLLISSSPKEIQRVVDAHLNHDTLASESHYRNFTRWQPRQVLGQFYLSPKLMESYQEFARSMDSSMTTQLGDLLSRLSPASEPLTYALSNEGLGPMHELRIPKNLAVLMLASLFGVPSQTASPPNEAMAQGTLRAVASAEATYRATNKDGSYASKDQLIELGLIAKEAFERNGYRIELSASGTKFEASAVPLEYGKTGKLSFFVDESNVLRAGDHGGGAATVADKPVQ